MSVGRELLNCAHSQEQHCQHVSSLQVTWSMKAINLFFSENAGLTGDEVAGVVELLRDEHVAGMFCAMPSSSRNSWILSQIKAISVSPFED
jgi:hypothetical protein